MKTVDDMILYLRDVKFTVIKEKPDTRRSRRYKKTPRDGEYSSLEHATHKDQYYVSIYDSREKSLIWDGYYNPNGVFYFSTTGFVNIHIVAYGHKTQVYHNKHVYEGQPIKFRLRAE